MKSKLNLHIVFTNPSFKNLLQSKDQFLLKEKFEMFATNQILYFVLNFDPLCPDMIGCHHQSSKKFSRFLAPTYPNKVLFYPFQSPRIGTFSHADFIGLKNVKYGIGFQAACSYGQPHKAIICVVVCLFVFEIQTKENKEEGRSEVLLRHFYEYHTEKLNVQRRNMPRFKGFATINLLLLFLQPHSVTCRA